MADVRAYPGTPPVAAFGGVSSPSPSTPLIVDSTTGDLYVVINGAVVKATAVAGAVWGA